MKWIVAFLTGMSLILVSCSTMPNFKDTSIKAHWIKKGEKAPFDGIELNSFTYYKLVKQAQKCKE